MTEYQPVYQKTKKGGESKQDSKIYVSYSLPELGDKAPDGKRYPKPPTFFVKVDAPKSMYLTIAEASEMKTRMEEAIKTAIKLEEEFIRKNKQKQQ